MGTAFRSKRKRRKVLLRGPYLISIRAKEKKWFISFAGEVKVTLKTQRNVINFTGQISLPFLWRIEFSIAFSSGLALSFAFLPSFFALLLMLIKFKFIRPVL